MLNIPKLQTLDRIHNDFTNKISRSRKVSNENFPSFARSKSKVNRKERSSSRFGKRNTPTNNSVGFLDDQSSNYKSNDSQLTKRKSYKRSTPKRMRAPKKDRRRSHKRSNKHLSYSKSRERLQAFERARLLREYDDNSPIRGGYNYTRMAQARSYKKNSSSQKRYISPRSHNFDILSPEKKEALQGFIRDCI